MRGEHGICEAHPNGQGLGQGLQSPLGEPAVSLGHERHKACCVPWHLGLKGSSILSEPSQDQGADSADVGAPPHTLCFRYLRNDTPFSMYPTRQLGHNPIKILFIFLKSEIHLVPGLTSGTDWTGRDLQGPCLTQALSP